MTKVLALLVSLWVAFASSRAARAEQQADVQKDAMSTQVVQALTRLDYREALRLADAALARYPNDPWLLYDRGAALAGLGHLDEARTALILAEQRFPQTEVYGRSRAAYRRAISFLAAGRCEEARGEFAHYEAVIGPRSPAEAQMGARYAASCTLPERQPVRGREPPRR